MTIIIHRSFLYHVTQVYNPTIIHFAVLVPAKGNRSVLSTPFRGAPRNYTAPLMMYFPRSLVFVFLPQVPLHLQLHPQVRRCCNNMFFILRLSLVQMKRKRTCRWTPDYVDLLCFFTGQASGRPFVWCSIPYSYVVKCAKASVRVVQCYEALFNILLHIQLSNKLCPIRVEAETHDVKYLKTFTLFWRPTTVQAMYYSFRNVWVRLDVYSNTSAYIAGRMIRR